MRRLDFRAALSSSWSPFASRMGPLAIAGAIVSLLTGAPGIVLWRLALPTAGAYVSACLGFLLGAPLTVGLCGMCLKVLRGEDVRGLDVFTGFARAGAAYLVALPLTLLELLPRGAQSLHMEGVAFFFDMGLLLTVPFFALAAPAVADGLSGWDALRFSCRQGAANWGPIFWLYLEAGILGGAVALFTLGIGLVLVLPWFNMVMTTAYMALGEPRPGPGAMRQPYTPVSP